jgi:hypothetical protein
MIESIATVERWASRAEPAERLSTVEPNGTSPIDGAMNSCPSNLDERWPIVLQ